jgi:pyruvate formate lyase activating enzyme
LQKIGKWLEIVYLVLPTLNDSDDELRGAAKWIKANLGDDVPLHFSQFHPDHHMKDLPMTPVVTLERAKAIADAEGLHYVYIGNVPGHAAQNTHCPGCKKVLVERFGFSTSKSSIRDGKCPSCKHQIAGLWHA